VNPVSDDPGARAAPRPPAYPALAADERALAEHSLGRTTAVLTDRRLVLAGREFEQSLPLAHIALVRVRFERMLNAIALGVGLIVVAAVLFAVTSPLRTLLYNQSVALESAASEERAAGPQGGGGIASGMQRILGALVGVVRLFPLAGWLLLLAGAAKIALGLIGRTVVRVTAGGAEIEFAQRGNQQMLREFVAEVGRQLPAPRR
jgi:hypothetical protein